MQRSETRLLAMLTTALGPVGPWLQDPTVVEIMVNPDGHVWVECQGDAPLDTGRALDPATVERGIRLMAAHCQPEGHAGAPSLGPALPADGPRCRALF